jgi:hypothetical protein
LRKTEILVLAAPRLEKPAIKILRSSPEISELAVLPSIPAFTRILAQDAKRQEMTRLQKEEAEGLKKQQEQAKQQTEKAGIETS